MFYTLPFLSIIIFLPLLGCLFLCFIRGDEKTTAQNAKNVALGTSILNFSLSLILLFLFDPQKSVHQFVENTYWIKDFGLKYHLGVDGISILFVLLTTFLTPVCILASWDSVQKRAREYMMAFLLLETLIIGLFCALDLVLFYVFFEGVLIPMFLIIGVWGGERRIYSCFKFFLYTLTGSLLMLLAILTIYHYVGSLENDKILSFPFSPDLQKWLWLAFFASFAVKIPMWPLHTWLPDAHVEAPTGGSIILAGVLLKMGGYGFLRFSIPFFPLATAYFTPFIMILSLVAIIYTSLVALVQTDMKKLIAYSSVAHMGFVTLGIFSMTSAGVNGAILQMLSHGIVSASLFLCVGIVYDRLHTRDIARYGGLAKNMPKYAVGFMIFTLASIGLPGTSGFVGEFLVILGTFEINTTIAVLACSGMVFGAAYSLWLYKKVVFGKIQSPDLKILTDLNTRELILLVPLALIIIWMGLYPKLFLNTITPTVDEFVNSSSLALSGKTKVNKYPLVKRELP